MNINLAMSKSPDFKARLSNDFETKRALVEMVSNDPVGTAQFVQSIQKANDAQDTVLLRECSDGVGVYAHSNLTDHPVVFNVGNSDYAMALRLSNGKQLIDYMV